MKTRVLVQILETPTEATGSPSEGTDQMWGLFSFRRPPLTPPGLRFCQKNPLRPFRSIPFAAIRLPPSRSNRPDRSWSSFVFLHPPVSSRSSPALVAAGVVACLPERTGGLDPCSGSWCCPPPWSQRPPTTPWSWELHHRQSTPTPTASLLP